MKKFAVLILTVLYMAAASGATVNIHYCMGEYAGWDLGHDEDSSCGSCGMDKKNYDSNKCCRDEHKVFKIDDVYKNAVVFATLLQLPAVYVDPSTEYFEPTVYNLQETYPVVNAPPGEAAQPSFIIIRSIRI